MAFSPCDGWTSGRTGWRLSHVEETVVVLGDDRAAVDEEGNPSADESDAGEVRRPVQFTYQGKWRLNRGCEL